MPTGVKTGRIPVNPIHPMLTPEQKAKAAERYSVGVGAAKVGRELGVSKFSVLKAVREAGEKVRPMGPPPRPAVPCSVGNCQNESHAFGLCHRHYQLGRRTGAVTTPASCKASGCNKAAEARGLCQTHYARFARHGDPDARQRRANGEFTAETCAVAECKHPVRYFVGGSFYCNVHGLRVTRYGDPHFVKRPWKNSKEEKRANAAARARRYYARPHGKMRVKFQRDKMRARKHGCYTACGIPRAVFLELYAREVCDLCGMYMPESDRTIDHIVPLSKGGPNSPENLQMAHRACNSRKGDRILDEVRQSPSSAPRAD